MLKLFLSLRYLRKKKIVILSIAAVALSVALLIVVNSLFSGFIKEVKQNYIAQLGDLLLMSPEPVSDYDNYLDQLEKLDEVEAAAVHLYSAGLLHLAGGDVRTVSIQGVEPQREVGFADWKSMLLRQKTPNGDISFEVPGYPSGNGAWLGVLLAGEPNERTDEYDLAQLRRLIGRQVVLTTVDSAAKRRVLKLRISDIAFTDTYFGDQTLYLPYKLLHKLQFGADRQGRASEIKIKLKQGLDPIAARETIRKHWTDFVVQDLGWDAAIAGGTRIVVVRDELNPRYFAELYKQMTVVMLIFGVICSVAILLVFCIFYMIVETKLRDIAIIKSCGAASSTAAIIFTGFAGCVGLAGSALGIFFAVFVTNNINTIEGWVRVISGFKLWRSSSYILNTIPNQVNWSAVAPIVAAAVAGCCLGALIPAIVAARARPVEILRYE